MGDQDDRAFVIVKRIEQRAAAIDIEMVGRLVEDQQVRRRHRNEVEQQPRALAAGKIGDGGFLLVERQTELREPRAARRLTVVRTLAPQDVERRVVRVERFDLVLVKPADADALFPLHLACLQRQRSGDHLGERRLARAVDAQ